MNYDGNIFRPPAEHRSILLQVTTGCSHNKCLFCGLYKDKSFSIKDDRIITQDLKFAQKHFKSKKRLFLCDGDAMIIPFDKLIKILKKINEHLPWITRIGTYANAKSLKRKSIDELKELKKNKLGIVYLGLESGDDKVLETMNKGVDAKTQIEQGQKVRLAGMKLSCTVLLGLGGRERSETHAILTGKALTCINPNYAASLSLMIVPEAPLYNDIKQGKFNPIKPIEILRELRTMIEHTTLSAGIFSSNHASNYLPLQVRMPSGKQEAIELIDRALNNEIKLKPEWARGI